MKLFVFAAALLAPAAGSGVRAEEPASALGRYCEDAVSGPARAGEPNCAGYALSQQAASGMLHSQDFCVHSQSQYCGYHWFQVDFPNDADPAEPITFEVTIFARSIMWSGRSWVLFGERSINSISDIVFRAPGCPRFNSAGGCQFTAETSEQVAAMNDYVYRIIEQMRAGHQ